MSDRLVMAGILLGAFAFYLSTAAPSVTAGDSGEFVTAAATLSIPHAPSFPVYTVLSGAFVRALPWGNSAYRANLFSALASAVGLAFLFGLARRLRLPLPAGLALVLAAGAGFSFWMNSLVTEVFALNAALALFLFWLAAGALSAEPGKERDRRALLFAFVLGIGLGNHQILLFAAPAMLLFLVRWPSARLLIGLVLALVAGLSVYGFLMVRASRQPPLNWGNPSTPHGLTRAFLRKDYGTLKLATGDAPERTMANSARQLGRFIIQFSREFPPGVALGLLVASLWAAIRRNRLSAAMLLVFAGSGPFFFWLGNLPFNAQSEGVMGRFFILPALALLVGAAPLLGRFSRAGAATLLVVALLSLGRGRTEAAGHRMGTLVLDYGRTILRTVPKNGMLLMDGGDDAFYSVLMLTRVENRRPDVIAHDRGGLVFPNPYGGDFRRLTRDEKEQRRQTIEQAWREERPLVYSTLSSSVLPGVPQHPIGFLVGVEPVREPRISWPLICLRSLHPTRPSDYRTRALAAFFPLARGQAAMDAGRVTEALRYWRAAERIGRRVPWFDASLIDAFGKSGYRLLTSGRLPEAEAVYRSWIAFEPDNAQPHSNLGVCLERQDRREEAKRQYEETAGRFPEAVDPVFNLAVLAWHEQDWARVVGHLEEVLRRDPKHAQAHAFLERAKRRAGAS